MALGESYAIALPLLGQQTMQLPMKQMAHDATGYVLADLRARARANWPIVLGIGLAAAAVVVWVKVKR